MRLIWVFGKAEYFPRPDWTGRFHLKPLANFDFRRSAILARVAVGIERGSSHSV
jgi:hypothetical protein